jgi:hypothetical protein
MVRTIGLLKALCFGATVFWPMAAFIGSARCPNIWAVVMLPQVGRRSGVNFSNLAKISCRQPGSQMVFIKAIVQQKPSRDRQEASREYWWRFLAVAAWKASVVNQLDMKVHPLDKFPGTVNP